MDKLTKGAFLLCEKMYSVERRALEVLHGSISFSSEYKLVCLISIYTIHVRKEN